MQQARFVISLDFELHWGIIDHTPLNRCRDMLDSTRNAIMAMLEVFRTRSIHATWATVGLLFCESKNELLAALPAVSANYSDPLYSYRTHLPDIGDGESDDPYHYAPSLVDLIRDSPGQEIASHTFGHFYTLEFGASVDAFAADLSAAKRIAKQRDIDLCSLVFPRNQYDENMLRAASAEGFEVFRGNPGAWFYSPVRGELESPIRRALRLADSYVSVSKAKPYAPNVGVKNVAASAFLRPYSQRLGRLDPHRLRRIKKAMTEAAEMGGLYHLWWHPHNFGNNPSESLVMLEAILDHFEVLRRSKGMASLTMKEAAAYE